MSDTSTLSTAGTPTSDPYGSPPSERWYRVIGVGLDADGALRFARREYLSRPTFDRAGAVRHAVAEAKKLDDTDHSVGIVTERSKLIALIVGKTGRSASRDLKTIVKAKLEIEHKSAKKAARAAKRTSRPAAPKRTSRKPPVPPAFGGAAVAKKRTSRKPKV